MQTSGLNPNGKHLFAATLLITGLLSTSVQAQPDRSSQPSIFENITLSPQFSPDPTTIHGISGGSQPANAIAGRADTATGPCIGYIDQQPDHTIVLTHFFNYLSLQVQSPDDTTLVVRGPGGSWCNDDYEDSNPGIAGQWLSGTYQVWVGSYSPDSYHPYVIRITETH
jgi:hypothetical protein